MSDNEFVNSIAEEIQHDFNMRIEDNKFIMEPAEAGIALLAAMSQRNDAETRAWEAADELTRVMEKLRTENAKFRTLLESLSILLESLGYEDRANDIERTLWPVIGVLEDGTEVAFEFYDEDVEACEYCDNGWACDCGGAQ